MVVRVYHFRVSVNGLNTLKCGLRQAMPLSAKTTRYYGLFASLGIIGIMGIVGIRGVMGILTNASAVL